MLNRDAEASILNDVYSERVRQDVKWGDQSDNTGALWMTILGEEFGESCKAWLNTDRENLRAKLIQVAAVAVAAVRSLDITCLREDIDFITYEVGEPHEPAGQLAEGNGRSPFDPAGCPNAAIHGLCCLEPSSCTSTPEDAGPVDVHAHPDWTGEEYRVDLL